MQKNKTYNFLIVALFAIAMAYLESAVVVYMRAIYYPDGFIFPLKLIEGRIAFTEIFREAATMVMLITVAMIVSKRAIERFAWFICTFAIWDIFYYVFLFLLIGWPQSILTWDILFLIPVTWTGPVLAPVINSITMILLAIVIIRNSKLNPHFKVRIMEWLLLLIGSGIVLYVYMEGYTRYMLNKFSPHDLLTIAPSKDMMEYALNFIPSHFTWSLFILAEILFFIAIYLIFHRTNRKYSNY
jgi:hypothetical protein